MAILQNLIVTAKAELIQQNLSYGKTPSLH
ncbi:hypothetical protein Xbed_03075 [Xenorhabdus beddingii]|uniref:Uncharacterized protein n=1 Tax=Xenorhabdus beddingii TaxID=40578 RepID=A0A1Y2SM28_9GAMM|nr:hypothetical protein Xbed_03075 [Xenorhabdus beddingii]